MNGICRHVVGCFCTVVVKESIEVVELQSVVSIVVVVWNVLGGQMSTKIK